MKKRNNIFIRTIIVLIAVTFIFSAYSKLIDLSAFTETINNYGFKQLSFLAPVIVIFELLLGLQLLLFINVKPVLLISFFTFIFFTGVFSYGYLINDIERCGCFGSVLSNFLDTPLVLYIKNIVLIILSFIAYKSYNINDKSNTALKIVIISIITGYALFIAGYTYKPTMRINSPNVEKFLNKSTKEVGLDNFYQFSNDSTYIAIIFSYTCPHCLNTMANVNLFKESGYVDNIIYLPVGGGQAKKDFDKNYKIIGPRINKASASISRISGTYPTILFIKNNSVIFVNEGFLSAPLVFFRWNKVDLN